MVESDPFYGYESENVVAHLTKLNDIATLFTNDGRSRYFYFLKIFPFSLKGDAKIWFNSLDPACVRSPRDMIYYFSAKYFPAHKKQAALRDIYIILCKLKKRVSHKLGGGFSSYLMLCLIILLRKNEILDIFYNGLTDASRDHLDSCASSVFRERTPDEAEILVNNMLTNENNWTLPKPAPEPIPKPTPKKKVLKLKICKRQRNL